MEYIYALRDPASYECRYVGKTVDPIRRLRRHMAESRSGRTLYRCNWLRSLGGRTPVMEILQITEGRDEWVPAEKWWIGEMRRRGYRLTNIMPGGEGNEKGSLPWNKGRVLVERQMRLPIHIQNDRSLLNLKRGSDPLPNSHKSAISAGMRHYWSKRRGLAS